MLLLAACCLATQRYGERRLQESGTDMRVARNSQDVEHQNPMALRILLPIKEPHVVFSMRPVMKHMAPLKI